MVIHHFNKLIRNKWVWGVFAIVISAAFCFDGLFTSSDRDEASGAEAGKLAGKSVRLGLFTDVVEDIRGFGQNRDWHRKANEVNYMAWEIIAALSIADKDCMEATDTEVSEWIRRDPSFALNGQFSFAKYQAILRENSLTPERYEAFLKRRLTMLRLSEAVLASAAWSSPMEVDRTVADLTDTYTVRVARFSQST